MSREMKLPELGENIEAAEVTAILVAEGDSVAADQAVLELETDKATAEVPVPFAGVITKLHVGKGDKVVVGQVIATLDEAGADTSPQATAVATDAVVVEVPAVPAATAAPPAQPAAEAGAVDEPAEVMAPPAAAVEADTDTVGVDMLADEPAAGNLKASPAGSGAASPSVRRLARQMGVDLAAVAGTGPGGRLTADDVKMHARLTGGSSPTGTPPAGMPAAGNHLPDFGRWGQIQRRPLGAVRRAIAANMTRAWTTIPQVTQFDRADVTDLEAFRKRYGRQVEAAGGKLTMTSIMVKLAAAALRTFPTFNSSFDDARSELILKNYISIGVAVDTERGLLVPVIRDVDRKSLSTISAELSGLAERTRQRKVGVEDLQGATFTISNLGGLGTTYFSPIVNWPEVAILGIGRSRREAVEMEGALVARTILPLSLSYDHRVIDGADAARFLRWLAEAMENPLLMVLEGSPS